MNTTTKTTLLALAAVSADSLKQQGVSWGSLKQVLRDQIAKDPLDALAVTVAGGALLFWIAERDVNDKCRTYEDALVFISTCLSVGYAQTFAVTKEGKAIATLVMTIGPAMAAAALNPPKEQESSAAMLAKLDEILIELRDQRRAREVSS
jgi:voltage-gated potassium channel